MATLKKSNNKRSNYEKPLSVSFARAAALFDKSETTIRRWARDGRLKRFYVPGSRRAVGIDASSIPGFGKEAK